MLNLDGKNNTCRFVWKEEEHNLQKQKERKKRTYGYGNRHTLTHSDAELKEWKKMWNKKSCDKIIPHI